MIGRVTRMRAGMALILAAAACAPAPREETPTRIFQLEPGRLARIEAFSSQLRAANVGSLCETYAGPATGERTRLMVEAELAARRVYRCGGTPIGARTVAEAATIFYPRGSAGQPPGPPRDCAEFPSGAEAQRFFLATGGPAVDPYGLDPDGDGLACNWASDLRTISTSG